MILCFILQFKSIILCSSLMPTSLLLFGGYKWLCSGLLLTLETASLLKTLEEHVGYQESNPDRCMQVKHYPVKNLSITQLTISFYNSVQLHSSFLLPVLSPVYKEMSFYTLFIPFWCMKTLVISLIESNTRASIAEI